MTHNRIVCIIREFYVVTLCIISLATSLAPRPNVYVYCCPIHINFDQKTCVWIARFARAILGTIDTNLATSVRNDFVVYLVCLSVRYTLIERI